MRPFDFLGLKNFRVFDSVQGFSEELTSINILTGANNSGKSSLIKSFQMLKNSIKRNQFPFELDLTNQEHLLGDFENLLFDREKRDVEISLPFTFLGITNIYINLQFDVPLSKSTYKAHMKAMEVVDKSDGIVLFSFKYREANDHEKQLAKSDYVKKLEDYNKKKADSVKIGESIFTYSYFSFPPFENPLVGYVEWTIQLDQLKRYLVPLKEFYDSYLKNRQRWKPLEVVDDIVEKSGLIPSLLLKSFKGDVSIDSWSEFIEQKLGEQTKISGKENVGEHDFESEDYFFPVPQVEDILYYKALDILKVKLKWVSSEDKETTYSVIENSFRSSCLILINRISTINYVTTAKEENQRIYNAASNSPFVKLIQEYANNGDDDTFVRKYLKAFDIGKRIIIEYQPKYQLVSVSIKTTDGSNRELVDFGYGIKQLIVFLIQINVLANKNKRTEHRYDDDGESMIDLYEPSILLVEEPESNLHPKWQSLIAEMFTEASKKFNIQLVIETHSEYLIRKFQTIVANKQVNAVDIKIFYLRSAKNVGDKQQVESIPIQDDGSIDYKAFDSGFFDESEKLELSLLNIQRDKFWEDFENLKNSHLESEDKIVELEQKIDSFTIKADIAVYDQIISRRFDVSKLSAVSVQYLISGQYLLANIDAIGDFSPVIIQYGRAIENELKQIFAHITPAKEWMLGVMQGSLEKFKNGTTTLPSCSNAEFAQLQIELANFFNAPTNLRIYLIDDLRDIRNTAGHAGLTKTKQEAIDYIQKAGNFLDQWIIEKK